jgi:hypothetical protein
VKEKEGRRFVYVAYLEEVEDRVDGHAAGVFVLVGAGTHAVAVGLVVHRRIKRQVCSTPICVRDGDDGGGDEARRT